MSGVRGPQTYIGLGPEEVQRLAREMRAVGWLKQLPPTNPYELLRAEGDGAEFVLWSSGKLAYRGPRARQVLEEFVRLAGIMPDHGPTEAGSDEAGKGEWLGPLVVAAVAVRAPAKLALRLDGVRDSKELSAEARQALVPRIHQQAAAYSVVVIGPQRFNQLWGELHARGETLNDLLWWAHRTALEPVLAKAAEPDLVVVLDEFDRTRRAERMFGPILPRDAKVVQRPGAGDTVAVGAASILARAERDRQVRQLAERFGFPLDLAPEAALRHPRREEFAKVAYLKQPPPT